MLNPPLISCSIASLSLNCLGVKCHVDPNNSSMVISFFFPSSKPNVVNSKQTTLIYWIKFNFSSIHFLQHFLELGNYYTAIK